MGQDGSGSAVGQYQAEFLPLLAIAFALQAPVDLHCAAVSALLHALISGFYG